MRFALLLVPVLLFSCRKGDTGSQPSFRPTPYTITIPLRFPSALNIPDDNPMTVEGVRLGRSLFYDGRISGRTDSDSMMCCATCHLQSRSFECGSDHPEFAGGHPHGITGQATHHFMLPLVNLVWNANGYLWNGMVYAGNPDPACRNLEDIVRMAVVSPQEIAGDTNRVKALIGQIEGYAPMFRAAFGSDAVTFRRIEKAIAQFVRTLVSSGAKFDRYLEGAVQLTPSELHGYVLFMTEQGADCFHCHGGEGNPLFTTNLFYNNGLDAVFSDPQDRFTVTHDPADHGAYRAPTLRNLVFRAPYMHDGRFQTLDQVLAFYNSGLVNSPYIHPLMHHIGTGGAQLLPGEIADLKAFLLTLTDSSFVTNPGFSAPPDMPE